MQENEKRPPIRFVGFTEAWEQRKLREISSVIDPHPSHRAPKESESGIPFIGIGDVNVIGEIDYSSARMVDLKIYDEHHKRYDLNIPSIGIGRVASLGKVIRLRNDIGKYAVSPTMSVIQFFNNVDLNYCYSFMNTPMFQNQFSSQSNGSTRQSVGIQDLRELNIELPQDIDEQKRIGSLFTHLDNLITLHQRKYDKLVIMKQAVLEKMFPQKGSDVPEIRFEGFTDPWEQRKLKDIGDTFTGLSGKTKEDFGHGDGKFVTYMNVFSNSISDVDATESVEIDKSQNEVKYGDVFFTTSSETPEEVGMSSVWLGNSTKTYLNSFCFGYRPTEKIDLYYLAYMLRSPEVRKKITFLAQGISRYNISKNKVMEIYIPTPEIIEQEKIGQYFNKLDNLITLHQRKLEKLKNIKKSMLEKMFV